MFRSYAFGIVGACTAFNMFGATKMYPIFLDNLGFHGTFWLYGSVMAAVVVYGGIVIQENKGEHMVKVKTVDKMNLKSYV